ncbi:YfdX family protein [Paraburkholderia sp. UCT31]|uniref:YfdX family protein n=1 Tax=Paraburkholderia sp. UCT31 TaxID=2615209 RepID=UPI001655E025|nr:YfdX family protein [Paraburkholderia sp. UCT31]MBC8739503.1 YfdX family protein [Paraburkholderia sp. UCT31]
MKRHQVIAVTCALLSAAYCGATVQAAESPRTVASDMGKVSGKGNEAFQQIELARLAIFNGNGSEAATLVKAAQKSLQEAQADNTAFTKAEKDLKLPPTASSATHVQADVARASQELMWLPVGADVTITDNLAQSSEKSKAVASANEHIKQGQRDQALNALKVANINVAYTMELVPLKLVIADVNDAARLISHHQYYQANDALRQAVASVRYDWVDLDAIPQHAQTAQMASKPAEHPASSASAR